MVSAKYINPNELLEAFIVEILKLRSGKEIRTMEKIIGRLS
jgi:hypothetical protein